MAHRFTVTETNPTACSCHQEICLGKPLQPCSFSTACQYQPVLQYSDKGIAIYSAHQKCCPLISPFKRNHPYSCSLLSLGVEYLLYLKRPWESKIESERGLCLPVLKSCESCFPKSFAKFCQDSAHSLNFRNTVKVTTNNDIHLQFEKLIQAEMCDIFTYISFLFHLQRATELRS